jgi:hypothetical protein
MIRTITIASWFDREVARHHPLEVALHERLFHAVRRAHGKEHRDSECEARDHHERADQADDTRIAMAHHRMVVVSRRTAGRAMGIARMDDIPVRPRGVHVGAVCMGHHPMVIGRMVQPRIGRPGARRAQQREQPVDHEAEERKDREKPEVLGDRPGERV